MAPDLSANFLSASTMSAALSDCGNTRRPRSVFSGTPSFSKKSIVSDGLKRENAEYKNFPPCTILDISVCTSQLFVRLHLPLPVIISLRPGREFLSYIITSRSRRAAQPAAISPAAPPPITITRLLICFSQYPFSSSLNTHII